MPWIAEAHRGGGERQVLPLDRHIVEPCGEAILAEELRQMRGRDVCGAARFAG